MLSRFANRLGIEFYENEIRIVEIKVKGNEATVGGFGAVPIESGYLVNGVVQTPELVGGRLRAFLDQHGISTSEAVVSFPTDACIVRVLNLPKAPESELRSIIDGEVEHYGLARHGGVYDFVILERGVREDVGLPVLLMASDGLVTESILATLTAAGLHAIALEPTHIGLLRAAHILTPSIEHAMFLTLSEYKADMCLFSAGNLMFYRSFDIGLGSLLTADPSSTMFPDEESQIAAERGLNVDASSSLAVEIRRSIDYFAREYPDLPAIQRIVVAANSDRSARFTQWLQEAMGIVVELVVIDSSLMSPSRTTSSAELARFVGPFGLAMRDAPSLERELPSLDLARHDQIVAELAVTDRNARIGLYLLASFVVASILAATAMTTQANHSKATLDVAQKDLKAIQQLEAVRVAADRRTAQRLVLLRKQGLPVNSLALAIGRSVPIDAGLVDLRMDPGRAELTAESVREDAVTRTIRALQLHPFVTGVSLTSYELVNADVRSAGMRFRMSIDISADVLDMAQQPALSGAAPPGAATAPQAATSSQGGMAY